ncbi:MAG TPA: Glu/Leu/Phe/Val dehydrogenase dimerization domain-containing protein [bacterium]|jgi:leucine dehydrogenase|nr:Glu/Leu/Phe/Val dehydrogenase dimerization domain-containing protein [bacterium]
MRDVLKNMAEYDHEQILFGYDKVSGLKCIIAIHNTTLGPALGGLRIWPYKSEDEALFDVLRLSVGMTYKNAAMGLDFGGAKGVMIHDPNTEKPEELMRAFGRMVNSLGGRYYTAEDVGTSLDDLVLVRKETPFVAGLPATSGNPSPITGWGVYNAMRATAKRIWGDDDLKGKKVAVQGCGNVGYALITHLLEAGAQVYATDMFENKVKQAQAAGAIAVEMDKIYDQDVDIFAPCALGAVLNDDTIPRLKVKGICGSANNQLLEPRHGKAVAARGILYSPDFIVNGGGVINCAEEFAPGGYNKEQALRKAAGIYDILLTIFAIADEREIEPYEAANIYAEQRIEKALQQKRMYFKE